MNSTSAQVRASVIQVVRDYVEPKGVDVSELLLDCGLEPSAAENPVTTVPLVSVIGLFEKCSEVLGDPCFGLSLSGAVRPGATGLLARLALSAPTVRDAFQTTVRYARAHMTKVDVGYRETDGLAFAHWALPPDIVVPRLQYSSFMSAVVVRRFSAAIGGGWHPLKCEFAHRTFDCPEQAAAIFGDRLEFEKPANLFVMDRASLDSPMPNADAATFAVYEDLARRWVHDIDTEAETDFVANVREHILQGLGVGNVDLQAVALSLEIGPRLLQRRLDRVGTSFEKVLAETRSALAEQLLRDTDRSVTEIAFDLGYSDPSVFTRAAHRWFNMSPKQFRQQHRPSGARPSRLTHP